MSFTFGGDYVDKNELKKREKAKKPAKITKEKRKNKVITLVHNLPLDESEMKQMLKEMKAKLGTGGSIKDETLQIQGDRVEDVRRYIRSSHWGINV